MNQRMFFTFEFDQFLSDFDDFCTIRMRLSGRIRMVQNHQNPIKIDQIQIKKALVYYICHITHCHLTVLDIPDFTNVLEDYCDFL